MATKKRCERLQANDVVLDAGGATTSHVCMGHLCHMRFGGVKVLRMGSSLAAKLLGSNTD